MLDQFVRDRSAMSALDLGHPRGEQAAVMAPQTDVRVHRGTIAAARTKWTCGCRSSDDHHRVGADDLTRVEPHHRPHACVIRLVGQSPAPGERCELVHSVGCTHAILLLPSEHLPPIVTMAIGEPLPDVVYATLNGDGVPVESGNPSLQLRVLRIGAKGADLGQPGCVFSMGGPPDVRRRPQGFGYRSALDVAERREGLEAGLASSSTLVVAEHRMDPEPKKFG